MNFFDFLFRTGGFRRPSAGTKGQNSGCPPGFLSFSAPVPRCGLAMTQNRDVFIWKTNVLCGYFLHGVAPHRFSNASFRKLFRFPAKPTRFVIARRAHFSARRGNLKVEGMGSRNEVCKHETRQEAECVGAECRTHTVLLCFPMLRSGMPVRSVKDCRVALLLAMT